MDKQQQQQCFIECSDPSIGEKPHPGTPEHLTTVVIITMAIGVIFMCDLLISMTL